MCGVPLLKSNTMKSKEETNLLKVILDVTIVQRVHTVMLYIASA